MSSQLFHDSSVETITQGNFNQPRASGDSFASYSNSESPPVYDDVRDNELIARYASAARAASVSDVPGATTPQLTAQWSTSVLPFVEGYTAHQMLSPVAIGGGQDALDTFECQQWVASHVFLGDEIYRYALLNDITYARGLATIFSTPSSSQPAPMPVTNWGIIPHLMHHYRRALHIEPGPAAWADSLPSLHRAPPPPARVTNPHAPAADDMIRRWAEHERTHQNNQFDAANAIAARQLWQMGLSSIGRVLNFSRLWRGSRSQASTPGPSRGATRGFNTPGAEGVTNHDLYLLTTRRNERELLNVPGWISRVRGLGFVLTDAAAGAIANTVVDYLFSVIKRGHGQ